jgi:ABC-2 type transport system permease protein
VTGWRDALATEWLKARRSRVPRGVVAGFSLAPVVCGLFMIILKDPEAARRTGLLGTKAALAAGTADWPTMLSMLAQAIAIGGGILFAFLTAWVFGREFSDRTVRGLLAIPTRRRAIVVAKATVILGWGIAALAWVIGLGFAIGFLVGLPGWSADGAGAALSRMAAAGVLTLLLQTATALFAGVGRGYLAPLAWAFATIAAAQVLAVLGLGSVFPWAVPALVSGAAGPEAADVPPASYVIVLATGMIGLLATIAWWERADQTG